MKARRRIHFALSDKISLTVIAVGVLGLVLVFYTSQYYRNIAYEHYQRSLYILATIKIEEIVDNLKSDAADLARAIEQQPGFEALISADQRQDLTNRLDDQFYQYFVTANIIDLVKLYVVDTDYRLLGMSSEGAETDASAPLICPQLGQNARARRGAEKLQLVSGTCNHQGKPVFVLISPIGGLKPVGYIQITASLASSLVQLENALGMPIQIRLPDGGVHYQSTDWVDSSADSDRLPVIYQVNTHDGEIASDVVLLADMTDFNQRVLSHRNWVMALATLAVAATVILILYILQSSTITPISRIQNILGLIHQRGSDRESDNRVLFTQLLENIIVLQKNRKRRFAVMILDLKRFAAVNEQFGHDAGTELLRRIGERLSGILRDSDYLSWSGTDTPGHKMFSAGTKTEYRATLARLGGDEFGMLLPTVASERQAIAVARRIIDSMETEYTINNQSITIHCCIGISIYPDHGDNEQELIRNADKAMFKARQERGKYCIYSAKAI